MFVAPLDLQLAMAQRLPTVPPYHTCVDCVFHLHCYLRDVVSGKLNCCARFKLPRRSSWLLRTGRSILANFQPTSRFLIIHTRRFLTQVFIVVVLGVPNNAYEYFNVARQWNIAQQSYFGSESIQRLVWHLAKEACCTTKAYNPAGAYNQAGVFEWSCDGYFEAQTTLIALQGDCRLSSFITLTTIPSVFTRRVF